MKPILIIILLVIIGFFAYNKYEDYQRFHSPNSEYKSSENIDLNYHDPTQVYNYQEAVEHLNAFVTTQWTVNRIDVKNPEDDDKESKLAVAEYAKKMAKVKFYETKLEQSKALKDEGLSNEAIKVMETKGTTIEEEAKVTYGNKIKNMFEKSETIRLYTESPLIYEVQKLLVKKGYNIPVDGSFRYMTIDSLYKFEQDNKLFPDGKLDILTLEALLE